MRMNLQTVTLLGSTLTLLLAGCSQHKPHPRIAPQADDALWRMSQVLTRAEAFEFQAQTLNEEVLPTGEVVQFPAVIQVSLRRPNRAHTRRDGEDRASFSWYDGRRFVVYDPWENVWAELETLGNIDELIDLVIRDYGVDVPMADLISSDPYASLTERVISGDYVGIGHVEEYECHHLAFQQDNVDWQIWVDTGKPAVPRKLVISYKTMDGEPQFVGVFEQWDLEANLPDEKFVFTPPEGAVQVEVEPLDADDEEV